MIVGVFSALGSSSVLFAGPALPWSQKLPLILDALTRVFALALIGWLIARLVQALATALDVQAMRVATAESAERLLIAALGRVAEALERSATVAPSRSPVPADPAAEIGKAIQEAKWDHAGTLVREFIAAHPDEPDGSRLARELETSRAVEARSLRGKLDAAREANDPDRVLELRDAFRPLLDADALRTLDQELIRWLMALIQKRLRAGTIRVDVVELAAKVAERFDHTSEGASLRAALPTLRRSAGLCARCGKPYTGIDDACPDCLKAQSLPTFGTEFDPEVDPESTEGDDPDRALFSDDSV
ncbi:hypothetical protein Sinac_6726 [Singulisphaera acidiphila DSM 18658]|uniref:Uncharacterized protein n=1 Tax=Singulisphaera acidiphila (strain ATCC BAA-1392 / DSM 18658 / VKM B-2454 / MOB10) TaxID=886293 RepID=L0DQ27_SINAD|nr:hypothetical protein Sinac_6726 [Singulisphaera acidiphila DSM 18658]